VVAFLMLSLFLLRLQSGVLHRQRNRAADQEYNSEQCGHNGCGDRLLFDGKAGTANQAQKYAGDEILHTDFPDGLIKIVHDLLPEISETISLSFCLQQGCKPLLPLN